MRKGFIGTKGGKRIFAVLLTLVMLLALLPATAFAAEDATEVWVGNTKLEENGSTTAFGGEASFSGGILILEGVTIEPNDDSSNSTNNAAIYAEGNLTIEFSGTNAVTGPNVEVGNSYGVYVKDGTLLVTSTDPNTDSLTVSGGKTTAVSAISCGIYTSGTSCDITIQGAGTLTANGDEASGGTANGIINLSCGVHTTGSVTVQSSGLLTANGGAVSKENSASYGVYTNSSITVKSSGSLTGNGGTASGDDSFSCGAYAFNDVTVSDSGTLRGGGGTSGGVNGNSCGVFSYRNITVEDSGSLIGTGGAAAERSVGVTVNNDLTLLNNGTLTGNGDVTSEGSGISNGVRVGRYATVSDSATLNGTGGTTSGESGFSGGVHSGSSITISNSATLNGTGGATSGENGFSIGVRNSNDIITISDSGALTGIGGKSNGNNGISDGVFASSINLLGGTLTCEGDEATSTSDGVCTSGNFTVSGGELSAKGGTAPNSYGVFFNENDDSLTLTGGVITAIGNTAAVNKQPNFGTAPANTWYAWKESASTSEPADTEYKQSSMAQFTFSDATPAKYLKVMPIYSVAILTNGSASFTQGTASADAVFTIGDSISGFNATTNYLGLDPSGIQPDLGTIEMAGIDGKVEDGSIKITFYRSYLNTLAAGTHTAIVNLAGDYAGVSVPITFNVTAAAAQGRTNPSTGVSALSGWIALAAIFGTGVAGLMTLNLKKRKEIE